jgi:hypothetical protein
VACFRLGDWTKRRARKLVIVAKPIRDPISSFMRILHEYVKGIRVRYIQENQKPAKSQDINSAVKVVTTIAHFSAAHTIASACPRKLAWCSLSMVPKDSRSL